MKERIRSGSIVVTTRRGQSDNHQACLDDWVAKKKLRATCTSSPKGAAINVALRYFFGGHTNAHGITAEEVGAIRMYSLGTNGAGETLYRVWVQRSRKGQRRNPTEGNEGNKGGGVPEHLKSGGNWTVDRSLPMQGTQKKARIDLGLALLEAHALPGERFTQEQIAAWCGCSRGYIFLVEQKAKRKLYNRCRFIADPVARALFQEVSHA